MNKKSRLFGMIIFCTAFGMILSIMITSRVVGLLVAIILLIVSYCMIYTD